MTNQIETEVDLDLSDLEVAEGVEIAPADPIEAEITASAEKTKTKKAKKEKAPKEPKEPKGEGLQSTKALAEDEVGVGFIADALGIEGRELRIFLRANYRDMGADKSKRYVWKKGDPQIQEIIDAFKAKKSAPRAKKVEAAEA